MVLGGLGAQVAETQIRRLIGHTRLGASLTVAQIQLRKAGATALLHEDWSLDDLRDTLRAKAITSFSTAATILPTPEPTGTHGSSQKPANSNQEPESRKTGATTTRNPTKSLKITG